MQGTEVIFRWLHRLGPWVLGALLFAYGLQTHIRDGARSPTETIYGDLGDGVFNLWVLEHGRNQLQHGPAALGDGRMFWPEAANTFWWSDSLLAFQPVYGTAYRLTGHPVAAYRWTVLALTGLSFSVLCWFFAVVRRLSWPQAPPWTAWCVPLLAWMAAFSQIRLREYLHFQQFSGIFLVLLFGSCVQYLVRGFRRDLVLMGGCLVALAASAPYFAILGACVCLIWYGLVWSDRRENPVKFLVRHGWTLGGTALLLGGMLWPYLQVPAVQYTREDIQRLSMTRAHWVTPLHGWLQNVLPSGPPRMFPGGYPGAGILLGGVLWLVYLSLRADWRSFGRNFFEHFRKMGPVAWVWGVVLLLGYGIQSRAFRGPAAGFRVLTMAWALGTWFWWRRKTGVPPRTRVWTFCLLAAVVVYGIAAGPSHRFRHQWLDPGVWGVFSVWVPGFQSMRGVIRFAVVGQVLLLALLFGVWLTGLQKAGARGRVFLILAALLSAGVQVSETHGMRVVQTRLDPRHITLEADEAAFFEAFTGPLLVTPTKPFHRNTFHMLRWRNSPGVRLVNGYSGRNAPVFEELMTLEMAHGRAAPQMLDRAEAAGVGHYAVFKPYIGAGDVERVRARGRVVFENQRLLVIALKAPRSPDLPADP